ncbi:MAG: cytochrome b N-terminal domain-containing protein [bacterium]
MDTKQVVQRLLSWLPLTETNGGNGAGGTVGLIRSLSRPVPDHVNWTHLFGVLAVFLLTVQGLTGILLAIYYQPTLEGARASLLYVTTEVRFGWLIRSVHAWAADVLFIVVALHLLRVIVQRAYHAPRGLTWGFGVLLLGLILGFRFTGHMLPGDQAAYWSAVQEAQIIADLPLVGNLLQAILFGSVGVSSESLSRIYAFHALVLPWLTFLVLLLHIYLVRKYGFAGGIEGPAEADATSEGAEADTTPEDEKAEATSEDAKADPAPENPATNTTPGDTEVDKTSEDEEVPTPEPEPEPAPDDREVRR